MAWLPDNAIARTTHQRKRLCLFFVIVIILTSFPIVALEILRSLAPSSTLQIEAGFGNRYGHSFKDVQCGLYGLADSGGVRRKIICPCDPLSAEPREAIPTFRQMI
jgi:hypothetical protein